MRKILLNCMLLFAFGSFAQQSSVRTEAQALQLSDSLYNVLITGGEFTQLASEFSNDPGSNKKGGQYNDCLFGTFTPEFEEVVRRLKEQEISRPFKTPYGYHIAQLLKRSATSFTVRHILLTFQ